jgi:hypothetical protein
MLKYGSCATNGTAGGRSGGRFCSEAERSEGQLSNRIAAAHALKRPADVAQIFNLPYRRIAFGKPFDGRAAGGLKIRDTAECNSALHGRVFMRYSFRYCCGTDLTGGV